jgi:hypothetical protein
MRHTSQEVLTHLCVFSPPLGHIKDQEALPRELTTARTWVDTISLRKLSSWIEDYSHTYPTEPIEVFLLSVFGLVWKCSSVPLTFDNSLVGLGSIRE